MKYYILFLWMLVGTITTVAQPKSIAQIKTELEKSPNPPLYVKDVLKKKFVLDTVTVVNTRSFGGLPDSLAYHGKTGKVYGPYAKGKLLIQVLAKLPNTFNHVGQIFIDTAVFSRSFADSLGNDIVARIQDGRSTFGDMARLYSMGGESATRGDLGWVALGAMVPYIEKELQKHKKGDIFKLWSSNGLHIICKLDEPKKDTGFALLMRILL